MSGPSLQRARKQRRCIVAGMDCHGDGFHELGALESHSRADDRNIIVTRIVRFRAPCICLAGARWVARHVAPSTTVDA